MEGKLDLRSRRLQYYLYACNLIHLQIMLETRKENSYALESVHLLSHETEIFFLCYFFLLQEI